MLPMPPSTAKKMAACKVVCGSIGSKIGRKAPATWGICPVTMIMPQMVHRAAMVAMSGKASKNVLLNRFRVPWKLRCFAVSASASTIDRMNVGMICHLNTMIMNTGKIGTR